MDQEINRPAIRLFAWGSGFVWLLMMLLAFRPEIHANGQGEDPTICFGDKSSTIPSPKNQSEITLTVQVGDPRTHTYTVRFCSEVVNQGPITISHIVEPANLISVTPLSTTVSQEEGEQIKTFQIKLIAQAQLPEASLSQTVHISHGAESAAYQWDAQGGPSVNVMIVPNQNYLPVAQREPTSTPTPPPTPTPTLTPMPTPKWVQLGASGKSVDVLALYEDASNATNNRLLAGYRQGTGGTGGGIYRANSCLPTVSFELSSPDLYLLDLAIKGKRGLAATFGQKVYYSTDVTGANSWQPLASGINNPFILDVLWTNFKANSSIERSFAGGDEGLYRSEDGGVNWTQIPPPSGFTAVRTLELQEAGNAEQSILWIGTLTGVWSMNVNANAPTQVSNSGLSGNSLKVRDILIANSKTYIATDNGVFERTQSGWQSVGSSSLPSQQTLSLAYHQSRVLVGLDNGSVYRLEGNAWVSTNLANTTPVRDLQSNATFCNGLLAATGNGVWLFK